MTGKIKTRFRTLQEKRRREGRGVKDHRVRYKIDPPRIRQRKVTTSVSLGLPDCSHAQLLVVDGPFDGSHQTGQEAPPSPSSVHRRRRSQSGTAVFSQRDQGFDNDAKAVDETGFDHCFQVPQISDDKAVAHSLNDYSSIPTLALHSVFVSSQYNEFDNGPPAVEERNACIHTYSIRHS